MSGALFFYLIISLICMVFAVIGVFLYIGHAKLKKRATVKASGIVAYIRPTSSYDGELYVPVFEFYAGEHKIVKEGKIAGSPAQYELGEKIIVMYNPDNPEEFYVAGDKWSTSVPITCFVLALSVWGVFTVLFLLFHKLGIF